MINKKRLYEYFMKKVAIIYTGGTIGMIKDQGTNIPCNDPELLLSIIPELSEIAQIGWFNLFNMDSCMINIQEWNQIAYKVYELYDEYDGFVIMHGTDTMVYTSTALSYTLKNLNKPIVFTGSQKPLSERRNDARNNIINSIEFSTNELREVMICFNNLLLRANRSTKISNHRYDAFISPNFPPLAIIGIDIEWSSNIIRAYSKQKDPLFIDNLNSYNIPIIKVYPNFNSSILKSFQEISIDGLIIEAFGSGTLPDYNDSFSSFIKSLTQKNIPVILTSQSIQGSINPSSYETGKKAIMNGAINGRNITTEAAYVKMMYLMSHYNHLDTIRKKFYESISGEID